MILTFAAALLAAQSPPQSLAIGSCVAERTSAADRQSAIATIQQGQETEPALAARLKEHVTRCTSAGEAEFGEAAASAAVGYMLRAESGGELSRNGIDLQLVDRWFARQSETIKINPALPREQLRALVEELIEAGVPVAALEAHRHELGVYIGSLIVLERLRRGLSLAQ